MSSTDIKFKVAWSRIRDNTGGRMRNAPAHLVVIPIDEQRLTHCGEKIDSHAWMKQSADDATRRCGRCGEAERNYLDGKVEP